jgi:hypothetical protein
VESNLGSGEKVENQVFHHDAPFSVSSENGNAEFENQTILQIRQDFVFPETNQGTFRRPNTIAWREKGAIFVLYSSASTSNT